MKTTELTREADARVETGGGRRWTWAAVGLVGLVGLGAGGFAAWNHASGNGMDDPQTAPEPAPIDGERALAYLKQICALGPRPAGSEANEKQRQMVAAHFKAQGGTVTEQPFVARDPISGKRVEMANLVGSWFPERTRRIVICAHYDTRPYPDQEPDPRLRNAPFIGANDGASGVALLMEIAHHLKDSPTEWGVDLVIFDGEELVYDRVGEYFLGSKEFARRYKIDRRSRDRKSAYAAGILLDMVGGKELQIPKEPYSLRFAGGLVRDVWGVAKQLKAEAFVDELGREVLDDHLALNDAGIPTIDLIDFDYPQWHTASDTPEQCSAASLAQVGRVVTAWLSKPMPKPGRR